MAADLTINRGDLSPPFRAMLTERNAATGQWGPIDLTAAKSITLYLLSGTTRIDGACMIASDRTSGEIEYEWANGDTDADGRYRAQVEIEWNNGKRQTVPAEGYSAVEIQPNLAED